MNNRKAFTIVELLTSITIIALLLGILLPSISMIRTKAKETAQKAQFNTIDMALEAFKQDYGDYPPSNWLTFPPPALFSNYCGAQKLSEALLGWDLMGFHPKSAWRADGYDASGGKTSYDPLKTDGTRTLSERKGPYLEVAKTNVFQLGKLFNITTPLESKTFVLCDVFKVRKTIDTDNTGKPLLAGAPILYYRANTASKIFDPNIPITNTNERIYDYSDNSPLIQLGKLTANSVSGLMHPIAYPAGTDYPVFYNDRYNYNPATPPGYGGSGIGYGIRNPKITQNVWPYRPDSYILISAGPDGYYGTADDIHNY